MNTEPKWLKPSNKTTDIYLKIKFILTHLQKEEEPCDPIIYFNFRPNFNELRFNFLNTNRL